MSKPILELEHYEEVLRNLTSGVVILDLKGYVLWANTMATAMIGINNSKIVGEYWEEIFKVEEPRTDPVKANGRKNDLFREWGRLIRQDDSRVYIQKSEQKLFNTKGECFGALVIFHDNTEEQHYISRLERARERAEEAAKTKTTFLANMSHELRTPLNSILGMSSLALEMCASKEQQEYLSILRFSAESLFQLISSLLDYIKLENGKTTLQSNNFKLNEFLETTISPLALMSHSKGLGLYIILESGVENSLIGDSTKLRQILVNLLNNAIKFTDKGEIVLRVSQKSIQKEDEKAIALEWEISDTGIGIAEDQLGKIFDPFVQLDGSATRNAGGTGIGLSITKYLVELMQGSITIKSAAGKGSTFGFTTQLQRGPRSSVIQLPSLSDTSIVLASSSAAWLDSLKHGLSITGAKIQCVSNVIELQKILKQSNDIPLVIFHGTTNQAAEFVNPASDPLLQKLRDRKHIVSMRISKIEEQLWQTAGFTYEILMEPVNISMLFSLIQILHEEHNRNRVGKVNNAYHSPRPQKILYVEDDYLSSAVHAKLMESAGHQVTIAANGLKAVECLRSKAIDLIILDIEMPEMNGFELASAIRSGELGPEYKKIILLALTAHSSNADMKHAQLLGINAFLAKPFFPQSLLFTIDRIMSTTFIEQVAVVPPDFHETIKDKGLEPDHLIEIATLIKEEKISSAELILIDSRSWALTKPNDILANGLLKALFRLRRSDKIGAITILEELHKFYRQSTIGGKP